MKFTYTLSREDLVKLNELVGRRVAEASKAGWVLLAVMALAWIAIAWTSAAYVSLYKSNPHVSSGLTWVLIAFAAAVVLLGIGRLHKQKLIHDAAFSDSCLMRATQSASAGPEGLELQTTGASARYDWSRFKDYVEDQQRLYLFVDTCYAVVIPKNAIGTPEELAQIRAWLESAKK